VLLEGLVTSLNSAGEWNLAPMGPIISGDFERLILRPFKSSVTYRNLKQIPFGVFHITDDVLLIARSALDRLNSSPEFIKAQTIEGRVLKDCCRWYEFEIVACDDTTDRTRLEAKIVYQSRVRDFIGFHRARHAVLEATILATRLHLIAESEIRSQLKWLSSPVEKTAGPREQEAFEMVCDYVNDWYRRQSPASFRS